MRTEKICTFTKNELNVLADFYEFIENTPEVYYEDVECLLYSFYQMKLSANTILHENGYTIHIED